MSITTIESLSPAAINSSLLHFILDYNYTIRKNFCSSNGKHSNI